METNRLEKIAKIILYVLAALLPLWFIPAPIGVELGREVTFTVLVSLAAIFWLLSALTRGEVRFQRSPILYAAAGLLLVFGLSVMFSKAPSLSFFFADPVGERLSTLILGILLMVLAGAVLRSRVEARRFIYILILSGALAGILSILQLFGWSPYQLSVISNQLPFLAGTDFNVIGTINGLSLFYAALFALSLGLLITGYLLPVTRYLLTATALIFFLNLLLVNFQTAWMVILGSAIFLFGLLFRRVPVGSPASFDRRYWIVLALLIFSVVMILVRTPVIGGFNIPAEVSPAFRSTINVAVSVWREGPMAILFGSGPGTFGLDWALYKDSSINQTIFWSLRFNQGSSWVSTLLSTAGILGLLSFLAFLGVSIFLFLKRMLFSRKEESAGLETAVFLGFMALVFAVFLYPANFSLILLLFLLIGLLLTLFGGGFEAGISEAEDTGIEEPGFWRIRERSITFETPWTTFLSSLFVIFIVALGAAAVWLEAGRLRAAFLQQAGIAAFNRGNLDEAILKFERAAGQEPRNFRNHQALVQTRTQKTRELIQRAASGENVQEEFQSTVALTIQNSQIMLQLLPNEPAFWRFQGAFYELIIPFIQGSERLAFESYRRATELDPLNPVAFVDLARAGLVFADKLQLIAGQASANDREEFSRTRTAILQDAEKILQKAIEIKSDFAPAHFLLAQTAIRLGNLETAIRATENARLAAPFDIGVAFQLGLLYYQNNNLDRAEAEFLRAISINPNYSNARYFLGLIYDRRGEKLRAMEEFEKVAAFNPDNEEVERILVNLRKGKSALAGIVPPAEPPEKRKGTPVEEERAPAKKRR